MVERRLRLSPKDNGLELGGDVLIHDLDVETRLTQPTAVRAGTVTNNNVCLAISDILLAEGTCRVRCLRSCLDENAVIVFGTTRHAERRWNFAISGPRGGDLARIATCIAT